MHWFQPTVEAIPPYTLDELIEEIESGRMTKEEAETRHTIRKSVEYTEDMQHVEVASWKISEDLPDEIFHVDFPVGAEVWNGFLQQGIVVGETDKNTVVSDVYGPGELERENNLDQGSTPKKVNFLDDLVRNHNVEAENNME